MSHQRRSIRLNGYDYSQNGAYFVTICTHEREHLFGEIVSEVMVLNAFGKIAQEEWARTAGIWCEIELDAFIVMPNHIHGIVMIEGNHSMLTGAHGHAPVQRTPKSLAVFVMGFKSAVTKRINEHRALPDTTVWQQNYDEAIIRSEITLNALRQYIEANPARWAFDKENV